MPKSTKLTLSKRNGGNLKKLVTSPLKIAKSFVSRVAKNTRLTLKNITGFGKKKVKKTANRKKLSQKARNC